MIKPINYRCPACEVDQEIWPDTQVDEGIEVVRCPLCGCEMRLWNYKNNGQRYRYADDYGEI